MKLRNKKTGEIGEAYWVTFREDGTDLCVSLHENGTYEEVHSLAELNDDWEDYQPTEPLIKDEKIRKAVRAWADANKIGSQDTICFNVIEHRFSWFSTAIEFDEYWALSDLEKEEYTIAELCGEEGC